MNKNSKLTKDSNNENKNSIELKHSKSIKVLLIVETTVIIVLLCLVAISIFKISKTIEQQNEESKKQSEIVDTVTDEETGMEVTLSEKSMTDKEIEESSTTLLNTLEYIKNNNGYIQCKTGEGDEDYITYMYNKKGEIFRQNQDEFTVFRNDGTCIVFNDYATVTKDTDAVSIAEEVLKLVQNKASNIEFKSVVTESDNLGAYVSNERLGYKAYVAILNGYDAIRQVYSYMEDEEYTEQLISNMTTVYGEAWNPVFKFYYTISNDPTINPDTNTYPDFSFSSRIVYDGEEYTQWSSQGYLLLNDWQLSENWYTNEFDNEEEIVALIQELSTDIETMLNEYAEENNIDIDTLIEEQNSVEQNSIEQTEVSETSEESEVEHTINENGEDVYTYSGEIELEPYTGDLNEVQRANDN